MTRILRIPVVIVRDMAVVYGVLLAVAVDGLREWVRLRR